MTAGKTNKIIGHRLKVARVAAGMIMDDVEKATGIYSNQISRYERGVSPVPANRLIILCRLYEVDPGEILKTESTASI